MREAIASAASVTAATAFSLGTSTKSYLITTSLTILHIHVDPHNTHLCRSTEAFYDLHIPDRLQRFVFGFLIIHHFYQLPTSA
ncbi:hypothetical protein T492DRAFT_894536 [Pavlovales sp. CCMP2436]|nr:hypothetical protein T492DRAFT_894536 [Pavlovales sp. CCMP2436]